jgi:hypothetical protein
VAHYLYYSITYFVVIRGCDELIQQIVEVLRDEEIGTRRKFLALLVGVQKRRYDVVEGNNVVEFLQIGGQRGGTCAKKVVLSLLSLIVLLDRIYINGGRLTSAIISR